MTWAPPPISRGGFQSVCEGFRRESGNRRWSRSILAAVGAVPWSAIARPHRGRDALVVPACNSASRDRHADSLNVIAPALKTRPPGLSRKFSGHGFARAGSGPWTAIIRSLCPRLTRTSRLDPHMIEEACSQTPGACLSAPGVAGLQLTIVFSKFFDSLPIVTWVTPARHRTSAHPLRVAGPVWQGLGRAQKTGSKPCHE
jgi:hypothetical protein